MYRCFYVRAMLSTLPNVLFKTMCKLANSISKFEPRKHTYVLLEAVSELLMYAVKQLWVLEYQ
jgi:hypothetical protein